MKRSGKGKGGAASPGLRPKKKPFQLEYGKCYEDREGRIRGPLVQTPINHHYHISHPFRCLNTKWTFRPDGHYVGDAKDKKDLVREIQSAKRGGAKRSRPKASPRNPQATPRTRRAGA